MKVIKLKKRYKGLKLNKEYDAILIKKKYWKIFTTPDWVLIDEKDAYVIRDFGK